MDRCVSFLLGDVRVTGRVIVGATSIAQEIRPAEFPGAQTNFGHNQTSPSQGSITHDRPPSTRGSLERDARGIISKHTVSWTFEIADPPAIASIGCVSPHRNKRKEARAKCSGLFVE